MEKPWTGLNFSLSVVLALIATEMRYPLSA